MQETGLQALDSTLLGHIGDLNRQLLQLLAATARGQETGLVTPVVALLRAQWQCLPAEALQRLARCPYLLLELVPADFDPVRARAGGIHEPELAAGSPQPAPRSQPLVELTRRALLMAWHYAQTNPVAVRITLGLSSADCGNLAALPLPGLERLTVESSSRPRLRWEDRVDIWRQLLVAAADGEQRRLRQLQLRGLQLLAARNLR